MIRSQAYVCICFVFFGFKRKRERVCVYVCQVTRALFFCVHRQTFYTFARILTIQDPMYIYSQLILELKNRFSFLAF
ncbi:hypothetical protein BD770DRAFT_388619, partial [Pilaira anomala]